jgi:hypothetical protein
MSVTGLGTSEILIRIPLADLDEYLLATGQHIVDGCWPAGRAAPLVRLAPRPGATPEPGALNGHVVRIPAERRALGQPCEQQAQLPLAGPEDED